MTAIKIEAAYASPQRKRPSPWPRRLRAAHLYLGALFAPALLYLAFTGGLQVLTLHKAAPGYTPPAWMVTLANVHKRQTPAAKADDVDPALAAAPAKKKGPHAAHLPKPAAPPMPLGQVLLKGFALAASVSLVVSTLTGLYLGFRFTRRPRLVAALVLAGVAAPLAALMI